MTASAGISGPPMVSFGRCLAALAAASVLLAANTAARAQALSDRKPNGGVASAHAMPVQGIRELLLCLDLTDPDPPVLPFTGRP